MSGQPVQLLPTDDATESELLLLIHQIKGAGSDSGLSLALRRFEYAYDRRLEDDRLIDHWIGLEALFTTSGERQETVDKISRRIARLLGTDKESRMELKGEAKNLYDMRSTVVHGGVPSRKGPSIAEAAARTEELHRLSIRLRLAKGWTVEAIEVKMMD